MKKVNPMKSNQITPWQKEQYEALLLVRRSLETNHFNRLDSLQSLIAEYIDYRREIDVFLNRHFSRICTEACYTTAKSACCGKDGILIFLAEVVINAIISDTTSLQRLENGIGQPNTGSKCDFLGRMGCRWQLRPLVCALFLCNEAEKMVFGDATELENEWERLKKKAKRFNWPDRPVLFDSIEKIYITNGYDSPLMYCHKSPGLLRLKKKGSLK